VTHWTCLEPDPELAARLRARRAADPLPVSTAVHVGATADLPATARFDTVVYIDVIEHIEDDAAEVAKGFALLRPGGRLVVLSPAHQWLFTPFDAAIGHHRRYTRRSLAALRPGGMAPEQVYYLDSVGLAASLGNRLVLAQKQPTPAQIHVWDRWMVPLSRIVDRLTFGWVGKSAVGVWRKPLT
jgi:hypothetical protein